MSLRVAYNYGDLWRTSLNGATVATALVKLDAYVNGMAAVVRNTNLPLATPYINENSYINTIFPIWC